MNESNIIDKINEIIENLFKIKNESIRNKLIEQYNTIANESNKNDNLSKDLDQLNETILTCIDELKYY